MLRNVLLVVLAVLLTGGAQLTAQAVNSDPPDIRVMLRPGVGQDAPRTILVGPRAAGVCYNKPDCPKTFTVMWVGNKEDGEKIRIKFDEGASACFDEVDFFITGVGAPNKKTVQAKDCGKKFFFFTISCEDSEGGNCGGVKDVDPGAMVDG
jgi:hypothetical protein